MKASLKQRDTLMLALQRTIETNYARLGLLSPVPNFHPNEGRSLIVRSAYAEHHHVVIQWADDADSEVVLGLYTDDPDLEEPRAFIRTTQDGSTSCFNAANLALVTHSLFSCAMSLEDAKR